MNRSSLLGILFLATIISLFAVTVEAATDALCPAAATGDCTAAFNITTGTADASHLGIIRAFNTWNRVNITMAGMGNVSLCEINLTGDRGDSVFLNISNSSALAIGGFNTSMNGTLNTSTRLDGNYTVSGRCFNGTNNPKNVGAWNVSINSTVVHFDNFVPTAPTGLTTETGEISASLSATVQANSTSNCTAYIIENSAKTLVYPMSHTSQNGTACSLTLTTLSASNTYTWFAEAGDGTNKTNSTQATLSLTQDSSVSGAATAYLNQQAQQTQAQAQAQAATAAAASQAQNSRVVGIGLAALVVWFLFFRKKR